MTRFTSDVLGMSYFYKFDFISAPGGKPRLSSLVSEFRKISQEEKGGREGGVLEEEKGRGVLVMNSQACS